MGFRNFHISICYTIMEFSEELIRKMFNQLVKLTQQITAIVNGSESDLEMVKQVKVLLWSTELLTDEIMKFYSEKIFTPFKGEKLPRNVQQFDCEKHKISACIFLN